MITVMNDRWVVQFSEQKDEVIIRENSYAADAQSIITDSRRARGLIALMSAALELPGGVDPG